MHYLIQSFKEFGSFVGSFYALGKVALSYSHVERRGGGGRGSCNPTIVFFQLLRISNGLGSR